jgi:hypothetical protein
MPMQLFYAPEEDQNFLAWMQTNRNGFVLNAKKGASAGKGQCKVHKAQCRRLIVPKNRTLPFYKTCSDSKAELHQFAIRELKALTKDLDCEDCFPR